MSPGQHIAMVQAGGGQAAKETPHERLHVSLEFQRHLERVYESLRGSEPTLSLQQVEAFMSSVQGQPFVTSPQAERVGEKTGYTFQEFLEVVWHHNGFEAMKPVVQQKDLSKPISNYFISSSHNTYLMGNQLSSKSSTKAYENVLIRGCRCIEVDVWNGEPLTPKESSHHRHLSTGLPANAASLISSKFREAKEFVEQGKLIGTQIISGKSNHHGKSTPHSRVPSINAGSSEAVDVLEVDDDKRPFHSRQNSSSGVKGEPRVLHGWTLTQDVGFREVCKVIKDTAFLKTNLPIIVSLEVHADLDQQEVMVQIMKQEWKGFLVDEAHICDPSERLPRLDELLNKILVKVKRATPHETPIQDPALAMKQQNPKSSAASLTPSSTGSTLAPKPAFDWGDSGSEDERASKSSKEKKKAKICESLSKLGIYTHSEHFAGFDSKEASHPPHVFSIGEYQIVELHAKSQAEMFAHNRDFFMRAYPSGRRIDSSNPDPAIFWRKGVQMVALNWQTFDEGTMLNEGMFAGEEGWVLKPPAFRSGAGQLPIKRQILDFSITILAGQHVPLPPDFKDDEVFHPRVKCELHVDQHVEGLGAALDNGQRNKEGRYKKVTKPMKTNHPDFGASGVVLAWEGIPSVIEELSFVRLKIEDEGWTQDELAAWACIRLDRLQSGYRFIKLLDAKGLPTDGLLLVNIKKTLR